MDFLDEQEEKRQKIECISRLKKRKQDLAQKLAELQSRNFDIQLHQATDSSLQQDVTKCLEVLDGYRLLGVSLKAMGRYLVLRFDPLYRNQYPTTEHYSVQLQKKGSEFELSKHNLPPFIPVKELWTKYSGNGLAEFVEQTRMPLYAYIQRREGLKHVQEIYEKSIESVIEVDLTVSYIKLKLHTTDEFPEVAITLQYSLPKCRPDEVDIKPVESEETYSVSKKMLQQRLEKWKQILFTKDIFSAISEIVGENDS